MITFEICDFTNPQQRKAAMQLLCHYMSDPMGDAHPLDEEEQDKLAKMMLAHNHAEMLLMSYQNRYVGLLTFFELISTFKVKPYLYIHDVIVHRDFRGLGLGKQLMLELIRVAEDRGCCKVTLEVREDNV